MSRMAVWRWEDDIQAKYGMSYSDYFRLYLRDVRDELIERAPEFQLGVPSTYSPR